MNTQRQNGSEEMNMIEKQASEDCHSLYSSRKPSVVEDCKLHLSEILIDSPFSTERERNRQIWI